MSDQTPDAPRNVNIWAPWRMEYINALSGPDDGCFLCRQRDEPEKDAENLVLWRGRLAFAVMNRFPYTGGHFLVAPYEHVGEMDKLSPETLLEMMELIRDLQALLSDCIRSQGFNIGINIGRCAGAGLPGHLHIHVVPRWSGDTNFMAVLGNVRVIPAALSSLYDDLRRASERLGLPRTGERTP